MFSSICRSSELKHLEGLSIKNLDIYKFVVHPKALQFYIRLYKASEKKNKKKLSIFSFGLLYAPLAPLGTF